MAVGIKRGSFGRRPSVCHDRFAWNPEVAFQYVCRGWVVMVGTRCRGLRHGRLRGQGWRDGRWRESCGGLGQRASTGPDRRLERLPLSGRQGASVV
ncbi:hypothetical protein GCM10010442_77970 [Kitasatospora kifunensis]|uniref:Uncharacterized protein n=1 Tax=Kitasatospora kifunensis TaxID=58351 RepID=A0A7W7R9W4_KITKI|nr:hypothetical protein [Kitasatospora kifunensis]